MYSTQMYDLGNQASPIRKLFNYGQEQAAKLGPDKVFDFTIGNPSIPLPADMTQALGEILQETEPVALHSYSVSAGHPATRTAIAEDLNARYGTNYTKDQLYLTCGAAAGLCSTFLALTTGADSEFIGMAPFFPEYRNFVETKGGKFRVVEASADFRLNLEGLAEAINEHTQAIIINSPNNPSGKVYTREELTALAQLLEDRSQAYGKPLYLITDEPYRELVYGGLEVPFIPSIYRNTLVCYSYSKVYSMPGERIGYVLVPPEIDDSQEVYKAVAGAARTQGYVCAPVLFQKFVERFPGRQMDFSPYDTNRQLLYDGLKAIGYNCIHPDGAFYMFVQAPQGDGKAFSDLAMTQNVLVVPGVGFGCPDYVRVSYCVPTDRIERALPLFRELYQASLQ